LRDFPHTKKCPLEGGRLLAILSEYSRRFAPLLPFFLVLRQYQIQDYSEDEYHGDAVFSEDGLDNLALAAEKVPEQPEYDRMMSIRSDIKDLAEAIKGMMRSLDYVDEYGKLKHQMYLDAMGG
jgi:hypothetical protein